MPNLLLQPKSLVYFVYMSQDKNLIVTLPDKTASYYVLEMLESKLIDYRYVNPWADFLIANNEECPGWLAELAIKKCTADLVKAIQEYLFSEPFKTSPYEMVKFHLACLWLRYERRELSWATFLNDAGNALDCADSDWECETPYYYLNVYESAYFAEVAEQETRGQYLAEQDLLPWIKMAKEKFEPFRKIRRSI